MQMMWNVLLADKYHRDRNDIFLYTYVSYMSTVSSKCLRMDWCLLYKVVYFLEWNYDCLWKFPFSKIKSLNSICFLHGKITASLWQPIYLHSWSFNWECWTNFLTNIFIFTLKTLPVFPHGHFLFPLRGHSPQDDVWHSFSHIWWPQSNTFPQVWKKCEINGNETVDDPQYKHFSWNKFNCQFTKAHTQTCWQLQSRSAHFLISVIFPHIQDLLLVLGQGGHSPKKIFHT